MGEQVRGGVGVWVQGGEKVEGAEAAELRHGADDERLDSGSRYSVGSEWERGAKRGLSCNPQATEHVVSGCLV